MRWRSAIESLSSGFVLDSDLSLYYITYIICYDTKSVHNSPVKVIKKVKKVSLNV